MRTAESWNGWLLHNERCGGVRRERGEFRVNKRQWKISSLLLCSPWVWEMEQGLKCSKVKLWTTKLNPTQ